MGNEHMSWKILQYDTVDSTNKTALSYQCDTTCHRTVIVAKSQRCGRGRQGRPWFSEKELGIYASIILEEDLDSMPVQLLSLATALAIYKALQAFIPNETHNVFELKWPNDVLADKRKISGILGEMRSGKDGIERVVIGFSVNVNHDKLSFPLELQDTATSMHILTGGEVFSPHMVLEKILAEFEQPLASLSNGNSAWLIRELQTCSANSFGRQLKIRHEDGTVVTGTSVGINPDGSLQFRLESGIEIALFAGDVHLL
jgi:BirA family biotin operon repressor/biotin-[acetyl-CoA-carboxylase] ligase